MKLTGQKLPLACCMVLGIMIVYIWQQPVPPLPEANKAAIQLTAVNLPAQTDRTSIPAIDTFREILDRPLFMADRRPYVPAPDRAESETTVQTKKAKPPGRLNEHRLMAVIITPDQQIALIQRSGESRPQYVRMGETLDGWTLTAIEKEHITLTHGAESHNLLLTVASSDQVINSSQHTSTQNN